MIISTYNILWHPSKGFAISKRSSQDGTLLESPQELARRIDYPEPEGRELEFRALADDEGHLTIISPYTLRDDEEISEVQQIVDLFNADGINIPTIGVMTMTEALPLNPNSTTTTSTTTTTTTTTTSTTTTSTTSTSTSTTTTSTTTSTT